MSTHARRFFGCFLPMVLAAFGCLVVLMMGYAGRVFVQVETVDSGDMGAPLHLGWTVIINNMTFWTTDPRPGNIVSVYRDDRQWLRRIVGAPGESVTVQGGRLLVHTASRSRRSTAPEAGVATIDGLGYIVWGTARGADFAPVTLAEDQYFVWADHRTDEDSRTWGPLPRRSIYGRAWFLRRPDGGLEAVAGGPPSAE